ncbi:MAG: hypothetical protein II786_00480 [Muribaculaceae bacterium]|nr:hypothetical protein [Muribaculaceae bacterium]
MLLSISCHSCRNPLSFARGWFASSVPHLCPITLGSFLPHTCPKDGCTHG